MKTKVQILSIFGNLLFEYESEDNSVKKTLVEAAKSRANLSGANLYGADLYGANLYGANLYGANLYGANLYGANLSGANLSGADLSGADLSGANLYGADLSGADLKKLPQRWLDLCRQDLWAVLCSAPAEVEGLRAAIADGKIDGSAYTGDCACLVGTIAKVRGVNYQELGILKPDSSRPAEVFFTSIKEGDTPETSEFSKLALSWVDEFLYNMKTTFGKGVSMENKTIADELIDKMNKESYEAHLERERRLKAFPVMLEALKAITPIYVSYAEDCYLLAGNTYQENEDQLLILAKEAIRMAEEGK